MSESVAVDAIPAPVKLELGQKVRFVRMLWRTAVDVPPGSPHPNGYRMEWQERLRDGVGVVVGYRTLSNGYIREYRYDSMTGESGSKEWVPTSYVRCVLVAYSLYAHPLRVPVDAVTALPPNTPL